MVEAAAISAAVSMEDATGTSDPVAAAELPFDRPAIYTAASFRLPVPFRTQKDGSQFQGSNCGPAALAMVLEAYGISETNAELRFLTHTYQGTVGRRGGTALQHMATVGGDFGLEPIGLYQGDDFRRWSVDDIRAQLRAGNVVIPLVKYRQLPGNERSTIRFDHYIVIYGLDGDRFLYHDPAYAAEEEGAARWITSGQLDAAIAPTFPPRQIVAFGSGRFAQLPAQPV
jgi:ABC-type bacteriocin/lantibiotic exporter with double-glycine peptidase domain